MNLIDRYVVEVGRHLPEKSRADIEAEIRSILEDMLEDRSQKTGHPADENMVVEVLKEFGAPEKIAASYLPERYLIGPRLYPTFQLVLKIVFSVLGTAALIFLGFEISKTGMEVNKLLPIIFKSLTGILSGAIQAFGNIVLIFAILQWALPASEFEDDDKKEWDPRKLPDISEPNRISMGEMIWEVVFTIAALLILNFYPQIIGIGFLANEKWTFLPILSEAFFRYLPWINLLWICQLIQNFALLRQGHWNIIARWFKLALNVFGIGLTYALLKGPSIVGLTAEKLQSVGIFEPRTASTLANVIGWGVTLGLSVALIVGVAEAAKTLYNLVVKRSKPVMLPKS